MFEEKITVLNSSAGAVMDDLDSGKRTYTVSEIQDICDIGWATAYRLIKRNCFKTVKIGGHIRISRKSFDSWLDGQE